MRSISAYKSALRTDNVSLGGVLEICPSGRHAWYEGPNGRVRKPIVKGMTFRRADPARPYVKPVVKIPPPLPEPTVAVAVVDYGASKPGLLQRFWRWALSLIGL